MKRRIFAATLVAILALGSYIAVQYHHPGEKISNVTLANIEALADPSEFKIRPGAPCYTSGHYDINSPDAVVCGNPCTVEPHYPGIIIHTSYCPDGDSE